MRSLTTSERSAFFSIHPNPRGDTKPLVVAARLEWHLAGDKGMVWKTLQMDSVDWAFMCQLRDLASALPSNNFTLRRHWANCPDEWGEDDW